MSAQDTTAADRDMAVGVLFGELTDPAHAARLNTLLEGLTAIAGIAVNVLIELAYEMAGPEKESRAMAREAVESVLTTKFEEEVQGALAAEELGDEGTDSTQS